ncbi:ice-binding family protein [Sphaerisporangium album]|uniref:ice-binding family protein n=1 Tax=Sphaerisporangium album TaxID=509200 RepID=UPI0015F03553|nr:ice-binding family protein [Sphaerisporangium album]
MLAAALTATVAVWVVAAAPGAGAAAQPVPVPLGAAANFAVLGGVSVTNTGTTHITGDVGVSPGTTVTGFTPPSIVNGVIHHNDATAVLALSNLATAFANIAARPLTNPIAAALGGQTLTPGVYTTAAGAFTLSGTLTLNAQGDPNAVFIIRGSGLSVAAGATVALTGGARACNVFFAFTGPVTLGSGATLRGNLLVVPTTAGTVTVGRNATVEGRVLVGPLGTVAVDSSTITRPTGCLAPRPTTTTVVSSCTKSGKQGPLTLTATVRTANGPVTAGQVTFTSDGTAVGTADLDASGRATLANPALAEGERRIVARFPGAAELDPSASEPLTMKVGPNGTCPEECDEEDKEDKEFAEHVKQDRRDKRRFTRHHVRHDRHHHDDHGKLVTWQTLNTLTEGFHDGGHHRHHSHHGGYGRHHHGYPHHHEKPYKKHHYKKHFKPHYHKHYQAPRPRVAVTG